MAGGSINKSQGFRMQNEVKEINRRGHGVSLGTGRIQGYASMMEGTMGGVQIEGEWWQKIADGSRTAGEKGQKNCRKRVWNLQPTNALLDGLKVALGSNFFPLLCALAPFLDCRTFTPAKSIARDRHAGHYSEYCVSLPESSLAEAARAEEAYEGMTWPGGPWLPLSRGTLSVSSRPS